MSDHEIPISKGKKKDSLFLAKDGRYYDTYTKMCQANIQHNERVLQAKGLDFASLRSILRAGSPKTRGTAVSPSSSSSPEDRQQRRKAKRSAPTPPTRRSSRIRNVPAEQDRRPREGGEDGGPEEDDDNADNQRQQQQPTTTEVMEVRWKMRRYNKSTTAITKMRGTALTAEDRDILLSSSVFAPASNDAVLLSKFERYLNRVEALSEQNVRSVLRQVKKLMAGTPITYHHWRDSVAFVARGTASTKNKTAAASTREAAGVNLGTDFESLYEQACDFEDEHGRDLGNGALCIAVSAILAVDSFCFPCACLRFLVVLWSPPNFVLF
jgi:hypothetical protein